MQRPAKSNHEDFQYWLADMDDALERFFGVLPEQVRKRLDFSASSLDSLEQWILEKYPNPMAMVQPNEAKIVDGLARYVGETFRTIGAGRWDINLEDSNDAFFGIPVLIGLNNLPSTHCPLTLVTASSDRRTGKYLRTVLENSMKP